MGRHLVKGDRERGFALVGGLMLVFIITLLGLALYDLAVLEGRLVLGTEADYRAFEAAQAGLERALHLLFLDLCAGDLACVDPPAADWAKGTINGTAWGPSGDAYAGPGTGTFTDFSPLVGQAVANGAFSGTYSVQFMNLTKAGAAAIGLACDAAGATSPCKDLIYVRSTADFTRGTMTSTRTIQMVARALNNKTFGGGLLAGEPSGTTIQGNALIAAWLHIVGCGTPPCAVLDFSGNAGVRNNYNDMPSVLQERALPLPRVCPPENLGCADGAKVESLSAAVRVATPKTTAAINLSGNASLGEGGVGTNPYTGKPGKRTVDEVLIGDGCDLTDCSDTVGGNKGARSVYSDRGIKPYDADPPAPFPRLDDQVKIFGITYPDYAECPAGNCNVGATADFFIAHAFKIVSTTMDDSMSLNVYNILTGQSGQRWDDGTPSFSKTFVCGANCNDANGARVNGKVGSIAPTTFKIAWDQPSQTLSILACDAGCVPLSDATEPVLPVLLYVDGPLKICQGCHNKTFFYAGQVIILAKGDIAIDPSLLTVCDPSCPDPNSFPKKNLFAALTPGSIDMGLTANRDMMGVFYAGTQWRTAKQTNLAGTVVAYRFDMGGQVPGFFQVPQLGVGLPPTLLLPRGPAWRVTTARWRQCVGALPSGAC